LDELEGAPELFRLERVEVEDQPEPAWAYFYQGDPGCASWYPARRWRQRSGEKE
jgi:hypothetical protein